MYHLIRRVVFTYTLTLKRMKKLTAVFLLLFALGSNEASAIGLPTNAYVQQHVTKINGAKSNQINATDSEANLLVGKVKKDYADNHASTLDAAGDLREFTTTIVNRVANFVSMILLSLTSFGSSLADEIHVAHMWVLTDFPPQV